MTRKAPRTVTRRQILAGASLMALAAHVQAGSIFVRSREGRLIVAVRVNGKGPFRFALDTGAEMSAVSRFLAAELHLLEKSTRLVSVSGVVGHMTVPLVKLDAIECDRITRVGHDVAVLDDATLARDDGILGADFLQQGLLDLNFSVGEFALGTASTSFVRTGTTRVKVARRFAGLLALPCRVGTQTATALVDCGAPQSIGNPALSRWLGLSKATDAAADAVVVDALGNRMSARTFAAPEIAIGKARCRPEPLRCAALPLFVRWGLTDRPALLLGLDRLSQLGRLQIDYPRTVVRIAR